MHINRKFLAFCRTVHIYLTMFGIFVMLLFAVTGFTINHEGWFGATTPRVTELTAKLPAEVIAKGEPLYIVEGVREALRIRASLTSYRAGDEGYEVVFKSPHEIWNIEIDKQDGAVRAHLETSNTVALINNLHRGRYTGPAWGVVIDVSAFLILIAAVTGVILWMVLPKRRTLGIVFLVVGTLVVIGIYFLLVPGRDLVL